MATTEPETPEEHAVVRALGEALASGEVALTCAECESSDVVVTEDPAIDDAVHVHCQNCGHDEKL